MAKVPVLNKEGKESDSINLPDDIFGKHVNTGVIHQAVVMYRASLRQGNASTKTRSEVSGGGRKPFRQKGTGRARAGSSRSPLWKGGGVTFGPRPRDFSYTVPRKIRQAALRESLNAKFHDKQLYCVEDLKESFGKTKEFAAFLAKLSLKGKILALLDGSDASIERVSKNIRSFDLMRSQDVNAYDVMCHKFILVSKTAIKNILERVKK